MTKEQILSNPFLLGRLKLYGVDKYHEKGYMGQGVKVGVIDQFDKEHGYNTMSCINDSLCGVAPDVTIVQYDTPDYQTLPSVGKLIKQAIVDEVDIISLSISGTGNYSSLREVIKEAYDKNILIVCSAGNTGEEWEDDIDIKRYPASYNETVSVGSVDNKLEYSEFSSHGSTVDLVGFGEHVVVRQKDGQYSMSTGTSFSTPTVAGLFALEWSKQRLLGNEPTIKELKDNMIKKAVDLGIKGKDNFHGYGFPTFLTSNEFKQVKRELGILGKVIKLQIGNNVMSVNGEIKVMDTKPVIDENNRTSMPLRAILEELGHKVSWEADTQTIIIDE